MADDFNEFCTKIGVEVPVFRTCIECDDIYIVDPSKYDKPKTDCDPDGEDCQKCSPYCICRDQVLYCMERLTDCQYPDCRKTLPDYSDE